jgi:hypothetical protein
LPASLLVFLTPVSSSFIGSGASNSTVSAKRLFFLSIAALADALSLFLFWSSAATTVDNTGFLNHAELFILRKKEET